MAGGPARIDSQDIIRDIRARFVTFNEVCSNALMSLESDVRSTATWLRTDRETYWKQQHRRREEAYQIALNEYNRARDAVAGPMGKPSYIDEKKAYERAKRSKEEAERAIAAVKSWTRLLEHKTEKLSGPCIALSILLAHLTPRALARLDRMADRLDEYFRPGDGGKAAP